MSLARYLHRSGRGDAALAEYRRAVDLVPEQPRSPERARALAALANGLSLAWRFDEALAICEQALPLARAVGAHQAELRALNVLGNALAYLGRGDEGLAQLRQALRLAEASADPGAQEQAYIALTDVLMMLGRPRESAQLAGLALDVLRPYGRDHSTLIANRIEALVASGDWDEADRASAAALRAITANYPHQLLICRAELETGRGDFDQARAHLDAAAPTVREDPAVATYDAFLAGLAVWERRWADADESVRHGLARARSRDSAQIRVWLCAKGLRAVAELAALARAHRDADAVRRPAHPSAPAARDRSPRRRRGRSRHTERRRLARHSRGRVRACPRRRAARALVRRRGGVGAARTTATGGLLPLAPGRGARRRRRLPRRGMRAAPRGVRRRGSGRRKAPG